MDDPYVLLFISASKFKDTWSYFFKRSRHSCAKDNSKATELKNEGNDQYKKRAFTESIRLYTKSLCHAEFNSEEYGIALANRSAVAFTLRKYLNCLDDIELCLLTKYPEKLRLKLHLRKVECLFHLKQYDSLAKYMEEITEMYGTEEIGDKLSKFNNFDSNFKFRKLEIKMPSLSNDKFCSASRKLRLEYNKDKGRHVIARKDINAGEILLAEKAYVIGGGDNIFEFSDNKCYYCLEDCRFSIPCKTCTVFIYCNESCRDQSWTKFHRFECGGIDIWHKYPFACLALKCIIKGARAGFPKAVNPSQCCENFGDGYEYFSSLYDNPNQLQSRKGMAVVACMVMDYLLEDTDFFKHFNIPTTDFPFIGAALLKSMAIIDCNSTLIEHCLTTVDVNNNSITDTKDLDVVLGRDEFARVGSGIFLSHSMMNHSCKPNTTIYYIKDVVIMKAREDIKRGEEVCNCYGVDYRLVPKAERHMLLLELHSFVCNCYVCVHDEDKMQPYLHHATCPKCGNLINVNTFPVRCGRCKTKISAMKFLQLENWYQRVYYGGSVTELEACVKGLETFFSPTHTYLFDLCQKLYEKYELLGDKDKTLEWYKRYLDIVKKTHGRTSIKYVAKLDFHLHDCLSDCPFKLEKELLLHYHFPTNELTLV